MAQEGPYAFNRRSAERITRVIRDVERGGRDQPSIRFRGTGGGDEISTIKLAKPIDNIAKDSAGQVAIFKETQPEGSAGPGCELAEFEVANEQVCAQNLIGYVKKDEWVYVSQLEGGEAWHIIARIGQPPDDACGRTTKNLLPLVFESCRGGGAKGTAHLAGTCPGPIESISVVSGGYGYAIFARVEPAIEIGGTGEDAEFSVTFSQDNGDCGETTWSIESVTVAGGNGYRDGERLVLSPESGVVTKETASLTLNTVRSEPTLSAGVCCGGGASLDVAVASSGGTPEEWHVDSVTVTSPGSGYPDRASVSFTLGNGDTQKTRAQATIRTAREEPTVTAKPGATGGTGAELSVSLAQTNDDDYRDIWTVGEITVDSGGHGYKAGGQVVVRCTDGRQVLRALAAIDSVGDDGEIMAVTVAFEGAYYKETGEIDIVTVTDGGAYYHETPDSVTVADGGKYYAEDVDGEPYVADVTVTIDQISPSAGGGAVLSATVDDDTGSDTFGAIASVSIDNAGDGYVDEGYDYTLSWNGMKFSDVPDYDGSAVQMLGHDANGCLAWFNITACEDSTAGVCCVDGETDGDYTTQETCESNGGTWKPEASEDDLPGPCCE